MSPEVALLCVCPWDRVQCLAWTLGSQHSAQDKIRADVRGWFKKLPDMVLFNTKINLKQITDTITCCGCAVIPAQVLCCPEIAQQCSQLSLCYHGAWMACSVSPKVSVHPILWLCRQIVVTQLTSPPPSCGWEELCGMQWIAENCLLTCAVQAKKRDKNNQTFFTLKNF